MNQEKTIKIGALKTIAECKNLEPQARNQGDLAFAESICERIYDISIDNLKSERECNRFSINAANNGRPDLVNALTVSPLIYWYKNIPIMLCLVKSKSHR